MIEAAMMPPSTPSLADVSRRIHEISTLPHIALRVLEVANDPDSGARDLKNAMETDVALSARVLRCVNSSAYAIRFKITNLQHAIAYLGVKQIRNLALTASVSQLFKGETRIGPYERKSLWRHFVAVGVCARLLAMRLRLSEFEDVFLAGLMHDVGIVLEDQHVHKGFVEVVQSLRQGETLAAVERRILGFDHMRLGETIARNWKLPSGVADTIRCHHGAAGYQGPHTETVRCVEVANFLCSIKRITSVGLPLVDLPSATIQALSLTKQDLLVLAEDLDRELSQQQALLSA